MAIRTRGRAAARPAPTGRTATRSARPRAHSLAPAHLGEAGAAAVLALVVLGLATFIVALAMIVSGITIAGRFGGSPPPNVGSLGLGQIIGGAGLLLLGLGLSGSALAVLAEVKHSRLVAAGLSGLAAVLSIAGALVTLLQPGREVVLPLALGIAALVFAASAILLARPRP
ncbi:MAG TPA: hypothetical protein VFH63_04440 [candidate division Zixibacteria bacterium]|nr:hypothetical protein [candidate division Zixibacteria bacterium]